MAMLLAQQQRIRKLEEAQAEMLGALRQEGG
jgi:hypothetical protein